MIRIKLEDFGIYWADAFDWTSCDRIFAYRRVSSKKQFESGYSAIFQANDLSSYISKKVDSGKSWKLFDCEVWSGYRKKNRPILNALLSEYLPGDSILVWHLDRLIRPFPFDEKHYERGIRNLNWIRDKKLRIVCLHDPYASKQEIRSCRIREGMKAKSEVCLNSRMGRPRFENPIVSTEIQKWSALGCNASSIAKMLNHSRLKTQTGLSWTSQLVSHYKTSNRF